MHLTKPTGCAFQIFGFIIFLTGIGILAQGGGSIFLGVILTLLGAWMFWRGRRTPEIKKGSELLEHKTPPES